MKRMAKIILLFICLLIINGCTTPTIGAPEIKVEDDKIVWKAVVDAESYLVFIDNVQVAEINDLSYELQLKEGTYQVKIKAKLVNGYSDYSNVISYYSDGSNYIEDSYHLASPKISLVGDILSWEQINHATSYDVYLDNRLLTITTNLSYKLDLDDQEHLIYVIAVSNNNRYLPSEKSNIINYHPPVKSESGQVNIFSINDTHGAIVTDSLNSGMDKVQTIIKELEKDTQYLKIANGDIFQGGYASNVTRGKVFIDVLNAMEFDCFVIGNHEFDWGFDEISKYNDGIESNGEANFPFLSANIVYKETNTSPSWLEPYTIVENNGYRVGVIGVIGEYLTSSISAEYVEDYRFLDPVPIVSSLSEELRNEKNCDFVIVATHEYESSTNEEFAELTSDSKVDAIICAHTHQRIAEYVERNDGYLIPVLQSNTKNYTVGSVSLDVDQGNITNTLIKHYYPSDYSSDSEILNVISKYQDIIDQGETVLTTTPNYLSNTTLGVLACNSMRDFAECDFACMNTGGVRDTIDEGDIQIKEVYEVFPFDNNIIKVTMTYQQLISFYYASDGYVYFSDNFDIDNLSSGQTYILAIIDYVYTYPTYKRIFKDLPAVETNHYIRDAVIWYFKEEH